MKKKFNSPMRSMLLMMLFFLTLTSYSQILYTQNTPAHGDVIAKQDVEFGGGAISHVADDFEVPAGQTWTITQIDLPGRYKDGTEPYAGVTVMFHKNNDFGKPGDVIFNKNVLVLNGQTDFEVPITDSVVLESGVYWMAIYTGIPDEVPNSWYWKSTDTIKRNPALFRSTLPLDPDVFNWTSVGEVYAHPDVDMLFTLHGTSSGVAAPAAPYGLKVTHSGSTFNLTWHDNSSNESGFIIERSTDYINFNTVAAVGSNITSYTDVDSFNFAKRYYYRIRATGVAGNSVASEIVFTDTSAILYSHDPGVGPADGTFSVQWHDTYTEDYTSSAKGIDDFVIPENQTWTINKVSVVGNLLITPHGLESAVVEIFSDRGPFKIKTPYDSTTLQGYPSSSIYKSPPILFPYSERFSSTFEIVLPHTIELTPGHYWISIYGSTLENQYWIWGTTDVVRDTRALFSNTIGFGVNPTWGYEWVPIHDELSDSTSVDLLFTLFGSSTSTSPLPAPIAKPALYVTPTSFTARWTTVAGTDHYELDVMKTSDSTFLAGYENKIVNDTSLAVTGTKEGRHYFYVVRAVNENGESVNSNSIYVAPTKNLTLRTVCSDDPQTYRRWKIINNNPFAVDVHWQVPGTAQTGVIAATTGDSFFITQKVDGINYALITWYNDQLTELNSLKSATWKSCSSTLARGATVNDDEVGEAELSLTVQASPNPVVDKFNLLVSSPDDGDVDVEIINIQGQHVLNTKVRGNGSSEVDGTTFTSGLYIIRATQNRSVQTIKIFRK